MLYNGSSSKRNDQENGVYDNGFLRIEHEGFYVACVERPIFSLSRKEFPIFSRLARGNGRVVTEGEIWSNAWGDAEFNPKSFRVHIASLRRKISPFGLNFAVVVHVGDRIARSENSSEPTRSESSIT